MILTPTSAKHFCENFSSTPSTLNCTVKEFIKKQSKTKRVYVEGSPEFSALRDCLLREAERSIFFSNALYANALRANRESTGWWSHVTLYYSAFFAAQGLLAMHGGCLIDNKFWLEVTDPTIGAINLTVNRTVHPKLLAAHPGSTHKSFWKVFYWAVRSLYTHAPNNLAFALSPVQSSDSWLIDSRNEYNYQTPKALKSLTEFINTYDSTKLPGSLPRHLVVMDNVAYALRELAARWRGSYNLTSDVLTNIYPTLQIALDMMVKNDRDTALDALATTRLQLLHV